MHSIKSIYDKILCALKEILGDNPSILTNRIKPGPVTKFSDIQVLALTFTFQHLGYNSESHFFSHINKSDFPDLLSRRQYNDRCKFLNEAIGKLTKLISSKATGKKEDAFIIDSMPLKVCRFARRHRNKIGKENLHTMPDIGFCAAQQEKYYGYKLHAVCSFKGVIQSFDITPASTHDVNYLKDVCQDYRNCTIIGDKGYISQYHKEHLMEQSNIRLITDHRKNQKVVDIIPREYKGKRKRIETIFSQLNDQFNIQRNYTKTFRGYTTRILSKLGTMTLMNYINIHQNNKPASQIKYALNY